jgi:tRNA 2-thiouridine synthesizing protein A
LTPAPPFPIVSAMAIITLDLIGLNCPLPALKTRKALGALSPGDHLEVHCSDPLAAIDIPNLIRESGDRMARVEHGAMGMVFLIEKSGPAGA